MGILEMLLLCEESLSLRLDEAACHEIKGVVRALKLSGVIEQIEGLEALLDDAFKPDIGPEGLYLLTEVAQSASSRGLVDEIRRIRLSLGGSRFVYHGTTLGRLGSIQSLGLRPGEPPVWQQDSLRAHCSSGVFFADNLAGAESWALCAFLRGRGRREGKTRRPVVIRLAAEGLPLRPDTRAAAPGSLMTNQSVDVSSAYCTLAGGGRLPFWQGLGDLLAIGVLPELPRMYKTA